MGRPTCFDFYGGTPEFPDVIRIIREIVSRDRQLRSVFDRFWLASLAPLMEWSAWPPRGGLSASIFGLSGARSACACHMCCNVHAWPSPACGGRIYILAARPVGFNLIGERVRSW